MQPRVTPMTASPGVYPAANALMPSSPSSRYTGGTGVPDAIAISSTTFRIFRSSGSVVWGVRGRPPIISATLWPPPASEAIRYMLPPPIRASVPSDTAANRPGSQRSSQECNCGPSREPVRSKAAETMA